MATASPGSSATVRSTDSARSTDEVVELRDHVFRPCTGRRRPSARRTLSMGSPCRGRARRAFRRGPPRRWPRAGAPAQLLRRQLEVEDGDEVEPPGLRDVPSTSATIHSTSTPRLRRAAPPSRARRPRNRHPSLASRARPARPRCAPRRRRDRAHGPIRGPRPPKRSDRSARAPEKLAAGIARVPVLAREPLPHRRLRALVFGHRSLPEVSEVLRPRPRPSAGRRARTPRRARPRRRARRARIARRSPRRTPRPSTARAPRTSSSGPTSRPLRARSARRAPPRRETRRAR